MNEVQKRNNLNHTPKKCKSFKDLKEKHGRFVSFKFIQNKSIIKQGEMAHNTRIVIVTFAYFD